MRVTGVVALLLVLPLPLTGCSGAGDASPPASSPASSRGSTASPEAELLTPLWEHPLVSSVTARGAQGQGAVSQGHLLASGTVDDSAGMGNPAPNVQLDYGLADAETGEVVVVPPLSRLPGVVRAVPGTDLFVAVAGDRVGVLDARTATWLWKGRARIGREVVDVTATRIWMGRTTQDGVPVCFTTDAGEVVKHDRACQEAELSSAAPLVDGVRVSAGARTVELPDLSEVTVPVTRAEDERTHETLWTYGATAVGVGGVDALGYETATFGVSALGLVRIDYRRTAGPSSSSGERLWADAVLSLVDPSTGEVVRTLGRVDRGTLVGFAGDVAVFEHPVGVAGQRAAGYRLR